ncbi:MAG TPA: LysM peptidoglycan-binding domain-containing protein [Candidatus Saccharimonadia bacterium]|nr:LysM peptidoglycan-binding domain-containing protein [Candidatus Saccharimonadia bacterium]
MNVRPCLHLLTATLLAFSVTSCATWKKHFGKDATQEYAAADGTGGGYNPYPGSSGAPSYQQPYSSAPQQQQYPQYQTYTPQQPQTPPQQQGNYAPQPDYAPSPDYSEPAPTPSKPKKKSSGGGGGGGHGGSYTVKQGDTLYRIASKNSTTVSKLKSTNGLTSDLIRPGQVLSLP